MGPICCSEASLKGYHSTPRNIPEQRRSHQIAAETWNQKLEFHRMDLSEILLIFGDRSHF
jgi:hypothetical protein